MRMVFALVFVSLLGSSAARAATRAADPTRRVILDGGDSHHRLAVDSIWTRRRSIHELEQRVRTAPRDRIALDRLGAAYYDAHFMHSAQTMFARALALDSNDADARFGLGRTLERSWLDEPVPSTLAAAREQLEAAVRARPEFYEAWVTLAAVRFEERDVPAAGEAARVALTLAPDGLEAQLAAASLAYRSGLLARADSLFGIAIPRCPPGIAKRFADITPLLSEAEQLDFGELGARAKAEYVRRFWGRSDPDPTTPQNEARLEFCSRITHALLLIGDPWSPHWLARTDVYTRYGHLVQLRDEESAAQTEMSHVAWGEVADDPTLEALATVHQDVVGGGAAVFAPLPPGARVLPLAWSVTRFEGPRGARLAVRVETPGTPSDARFADCIVLDAAEHELARDTRALSPSGCDPAALRSGEFAFDVPPGRCRVAVAVRDTAGGRGVGRADREVATPSEALGMSDVVLACGVGGAADPQGPVTVYPNLRARVESRQDLYAYFEVYHLRQGDGGANRCEYEYTVRDVWTRAPRPLLGRGHASAPPPRLSFRSTREGVGPLRRQFLRVPAAALPAGRYRLTVTVRDELAGSVTEQSTEFEKAVGER